MMMALKTALLSGHCRRKKFFEEFLCRSGTGCETARVSVVLVSELKGLELASVFHPADDFVLHHGQTAPGHCGTTELDRCTHGWLGDAVAQMVVLS